MFDIDAGYSPALRLGADKPRSAADEIADIDGQMEQLLARRAELLLGIGSKVAQAEPIRVSTDNEFWTHRHRTMAGPSPLIARTTGAITPLLRAAASGEIRDPADALRHEKP